MDKLGQFLEIKRETAQKISPKKRILNHESFYLWQDDQGIMNQSKRCMDCGVSFCHHACPLGNLLPELNYLVSESHWEKALELLLSKNNFPEFTGRLCPALCENACALSLHDESVTTQEIELRIIEKAYEEGLMVPKPPRFRLGIKVAVIGSGPAGLTVAEELNKEGIHVTIYEKSKIPGGLLSLGIPDYKLEKQVLKRRIDLMRNEGVEFKCNTEVGKDITLERLEETYDFICLATGFTTPRGINVSGKDLDGVHYALDYLVEQNHANRDPKEYTPNISAKDKNVLVIGGGDTGADCLGTAIRQGANTVYQVEIMPKPPLSRPEDTPWPYWPNILRKNTSHEEGGKRLFSYETKKFLGNNKVNGAEIKKVLWKNVDGKLVLKESQEKSLNMDIDLVIIAAGFIDNENRMMYEDYGIKFLKNNQLITDAYQTTKENIFATGDLKNGPTLICQAISDGQRAAKAILKSIN